MIEVIVAVVGAMGLIAVEMVRSSSRHRKIDDKLDRLSEYNHKNYMNTLRLTVVSRDMPIDERIIAGKEYIEHGGNGEVKKMYYHLLEGIKNA